MAAPSPHTRSAPILADRFQIFSAADLRAGDKLENERIGFQITIITSDAAPHSAQLSI
jgi:hypothetical protein